MSVLEQVRELEAKKQALLQQAHDEALAKAEAAIAELKELGYNYRLTGGKAGKAPTGTRRTGVRESVLAEIKKHPKGIARQDLLDALGADDKAAGQSVSNAIAALKKSGDVAGKRGLYVPA